MSETIAIKGTLKEIAKDEKTFSDKIDFIVKNYNIKKDDLIDEFDFEDERLNEEKFIYLSDKMYEKNEEDIEPNDITIVKKIGNGKYEYLLVFYTGATGEEEILEEEIEKLNNKSPVE